jgi:hypothetical protein
LEAITVFQNNYRSTKDLQCIARALSRVEFFRGRKSCELDETAMVVQYKFVPEGEKVFEMGQEGELFYILLEGHADVIKPFLSQEPVEKIVGIDAQVVR